MCQKCFDAVILHLPKIPEDKISSVLMNATCFPFGSPENVESNILELKQNTDGSYNQILSYAKKQLDSEYDDFKQKTSQEKIQARQN